MDTADPANIVVGERQRSSLGDLSDLESSIRDIGLLHPVVIDKEWNLIAGGRRLAAWQRVNKGKPVPVTVVDLPDPTRAELDENIVRLDLPPSDRVTVARRFEEIARKRGRIAGGAGGTSQKEREKRMPATIAARAVGWSRPTYERAGTVVDLAEGKAVRSSGKGDRYYFDNPSPDLRRIARRAREEMDRTCKVDPAYKAVLKGGSGSRPRRQPDKTKKSERRLGKWGGPLIWFPLWAILNGYEDIRHIEASDMAANIPDDHRSNVQALIGDLLNYLIDVSSALNVEELTASDEETTE